MIQDLDYLNIWEICIIFIITIPLLVSICLFKKRKEKKTS